MLRGIRVLLDSLGDLPAQARLLGKPAAREPSNGVPSDFHQAMVAVDVGLGGRDHVGLVAEAERVFERELAFQERFFAGGWEERNQE